MGEIIQAGSIELDKEQPQIVSAGSIELDKAPPAPATGPIIQSWKGPSMIDRIFSLFENPEKEKARATQALVDSQALGISPSQAYRYRDQIDEGVKINPEAAAKRATLGERVKQSFDIGVKQNQVGELGYQYIITGDPKYLDAINRIGMPGANDVYLSEGKLETAFRAAAKMLPMMADTAAESTHAGLSTGMAVAGAVALLGQAGPQAALPEEIVTVPAAFATGFTAGAGAKAFEATMRKEAGLALSEIITLKDADGKPIDPGIARAASFGIGVINGAIEVAQIKMLVKTIPGLNNILSKALIETVADKTVKEKLISLASAYAKTVTAETGQEVAQESTNIVFEELAKRVNNNLKGTKLDPATVDAVVQRLYDTAVESAQAFSVFVAPGSVMKAGVTLMPTRQATTQQTGTQTNTQTNTVQPPVMTQPPGLAGVGRFESGGSYTAEHPVTGAYGKYQIMPSNWAAWAKEAGLADGAKQTAENQETVAQFKWNQYMDRFGGDDQLAATAWFAGPGAAQRLMSGDMTVLNRSDANGVTVAQYIKRTTGREFGVEGQGTASAPFARVNMDDIARRVTETDEDISLIADDIFRETTQERTGGTEQATGNWLDSDRTPDVVYMEYRGEHNDSRSDAGTSQGQGNTGSDAGTVEGAGGLVGRTGEPARRAVDNGQPGPAAVGTGPDSLDSQSLTEKIKAINDTIGEKGSADLTPIVDLGRSVYQQGAQTFEKFQARMKELLSDVWDKVQKYIRQAWDVVSNEKGEISFDKKKKGGTIENAAEEKAGATEQVAGETVPATVGSIKSDVGVRVSTEYNQAETQATAELKKSLAKAERALKSAQEKNKTAAIKRSQEKVQSIKARIREITGQTRNIVPPTVKEYDALKAAFTKAAQAAREAYRTGNTEGVEKAKAQMREAVEKAREKATQELQRKKDIAAIRKLSEVKGSIAVDYQKKIRDLMEGFDFKNITPKKWEQLKGLHDYIEREGVPLGINPKRLAELKRLTDIPLKSLDNEQLSVLRKQLEELTALGKLKASMKYKYNERKRGGLLQRIIETTRNLDPSVQFKKGELRKRDKFKVATIAMYLNTLHTPRVADFADGYSSYKGEQARLVKGMGEAETRAVASATKRQQAWLDYLKENNIDLPVEGSESDVNMNIVIRMREGATKQAERIMKDHGVEKVPTLTDTEEKIVEYIRQDMERNKAKLAATWEEINGEIFPEQKVYYLPLKYMGEEELLPETQTEGRGRTTHTFDGFSHARRPNVDKSPRVGLAKIYQEATMEQEWYTGIQPMVEDTKSVVLTPEYKDKAGSVLYDWWKTQLDIMARRGWTASAQLTALSSALAAIRHNVTSATLVFKLNTVIMQPMAVFDAMSYVNSYYGPVAAAKVGGAVAESFLRPGWSTANIEGSEALKQRAAGELVIQEELARLDESFMDRAKRAGFNMIQWTDIKTAAGVQEQVRKILAERGMDADEAQRDAEFVMHMSQGSTSVAYRPHILAMGEGYRTWFTFQNFILNRWGILIHDIAMGKIVNGDGIKARILGIMSLGILMAGGYAEDEARRKVRQLYSNPKEDKRNIFEQVFVNTVGMMPFFGNFVTAISQKFDAQPPTVSHMQKSIEGAFQVAKGKDEKAKVKGGLKLSEGLMTIFLGIPGLGQIFDLIEGGMSDDSANKRRNR